MLNIKKAINNYLAKNYIAALELIGIHRKTFCLNNLRDSSKIAFCENYFLSKIPILSIIIVSRNVKLLNKTIFSNLPLALESWELILIENNNELNSYDLINLEPNLIKCAISFGENILPSEARNIGALIARGGWIYFIDDDAIFCKSTISNCLDFIKDRKYFACRGKVIPQNESWSPNHYDLGNSIFPTDLNTEGNLLIKKNLFLSAGGFDPLLFGYEGRDLTSRCTKIVKTSDIVYFPGIVIKHDPKLPNSVEYLEKEKRHSHAYKYMFYKEYNKMNSISRIFVLLGDSAAHAEQIIEGNIRLDDDTDNTYVIIGKYDSRVKKLIHKLRGRAKVYARSLTGIINDPLFRSLDVSNICYLNTSVLPSEIILNDTIREAVKGRGVADLIQSQHILGFCVVRPFYSSWLTDDKSMGDLFRLVSQRLNSDRRITDSNLKQQELVNLRSRKKIIFISFYTNDEYYREKSVQLKRKLSALGLDYDIREVIKPEDKEWPDICRMKLQFMYNLFIEYRNSYEKIIWTDVDSEISYLPWLIYDYDVDLMAFRRGFQKSYLIDKPKTRFWTPCFFVFKSSSACEKLLKDAVSLEESRKDIYATDDYFFEEAWRKNKKLLSYYPIPGEMSSIHLKEKIPLIQSCMKAIFYHSGDSGNVGVYKGNVQQHVVDEAAVLEIPPAEKLSIKSVSSMFSHVERLGTRVLSQPLIVRSTGVTDNQRHWLSSRSAYEDSSIAELKAFWWTKPYPGNMGDWLSPYILRGLSGMSIKYARESDATIISLGSIGKCILPQHLVWGTGVSSSDTFINPNATFLALRGPHTASALLRSGGTPPDILGDPAIILPELYKPKKHAVNARFALVRHYIHQDINLTLSDDIDDINILRSSPEDLEDFIDDIYSYEAVITTSLHVTILCHSYGIPCRLVSLKAENSPVHGDGIKYRDFYEGVGLRCPNTPSLKSEIITSDVESLLIDEKIPDKKISDLKNILMDTLNSMYR
jgi:hypothetical protein